MATRCLLPAAAVVAAACGSPAGVVTPIDAAPDAAPDARQPDGFVTAPPQHIVTLATPVLPDFIAFRDGSDGIWQVPGLGSSGFTLLVDDDYVVLLVCDGGGSGSAFDAEELGFAYTIDGSAETAGCVEPAGSAAGSAITVTGTMVQAGSVQIGGGESASATPAWTYQVATVAGTHDVLAIDTSSRAVLDRGLVFDTSTTGPTIDTATSGSALVSQSLAIAGLGSAALAVEDELFADDAAVVFQGGSAVALSMPLSELGSADVQILSLLATDAAFTLGAAATVVGPAVPPASYQLLPDFTGATIDDTATPPTAAWTALPVASFQALALSATSANNLGRQRITVSAGWLSVAGGSALAFDASEPEYQPQWLVDAQTGAVTLTEQVVDPIAGIDYTTSVSAGAAAQAVGPSRRIVP